MIKIDFRSEITRRLELMARVEEDDRLHLGVKIYAERVWWALKAGGRVFFAGNGGSAADAQHLAAEYVGVGLSGIALTTDTSVLTALGNDVGYTRVFGDQLVALARKDDVLVMHTTSGGSRNLVWATTAAQAMGVHTVGLTAQVVEETGGLVAERVDTAIVIPTDDAQLAQEVHMAIGHSVWDAIRTRGS